jgi:hypothetical protein
LFARKLLYEPFKGYFEGTKTFLTPKLSSAKTKISGTLVVLCPIVTRARICKRLKSTGIDSEECPLRRKKKKPRENFSLGKYPPKFTTSHIFY